MVHSHIDYPRLLLIGIQRINEKDCNNNGLLLRSLMKGWPRENMAQIFSYDDNGDRGFGEHYYRIGNADRKFGSIFFRLKMFEIPKISIDVEISVADKDYQCSKIKSKLKRLLVDTGLLELIFRPNISEKMKIWIESFDPQIILVQGYNLFFVWLALLIKKLTKAKLAFLTTDDWPSYLYAGQMQEPKIFSLLMRPIVKSATRRLISAVDIPFAFHKPMADEYKSRYGKSFITISHADNPKRFEEAAATRYHPAGVKSVIAAGYFNIHRWPLLLDADECCRRLSKEGIRARVLVISAGMDTEGKEALEKADFIDIIPDPGNDLLPGYLKCADLNLLVETFDKKRAFAYSLSVSTKSHLFMLSQRPTIVYAHPDTGVSKYALSDGWARVVGKRDIMLLANEMRVILTDNEEADYVVSCAKNTFNRYHLLHENQSLILNSMQRALGVRENT